MPAALSIHVKMVVHVKLYAVNDIVVFVHKSIMAKIVRIVRRSIVFLLSFRLNCLFQFGTCAQAFQTASDKPS